LNWYLVSACPAAVNGAGIRWYNKQVKMIIPNETKNLVYKYRQWGDVSKIAQRAGRSVVLIHRAFKDWKASPHVIDAINAFYLEVQPERQAALDRAEEIKSINEQNQTNEKNN